MIRQAEETDNTAIWSILEPVFRAGDTYAVPRDIGRDAALGSWLSSDHEVFVYAERGRVLGTYYICPNRPGGGAHVANCGYVTAPHATGRGIARAMLEHSLDWARRRAYRAIQFNFVVATNTRAIATWEKYGFRVVGRLEKAFEHPSEGFVDGLVMYLWLEDA